VIRFVILGALLAALALAPASARAFCGFYVGSSDGARASEATMVVLLRAGTQTVLSMRNDYHGPPEDFAMVVPVPEVLSEDDVKVLSSDIFERLERLGAPRLVEYWEQDPCGSGGSASSFPRRTGGGGPRGGGGSGEGASGVTVEAAFEVGEYDIVILSARDSAGLDTWLRENGYRIPEGAGRVLRPYVESGSKFFVAKVDIERVTLEDGRAVLSPLRVQYESETFSLPVRLGLLSSSGTQDLLVNIIASRQRYEVANYENVTIPTNLVVADEVRDRFGEVYAALFDATLAAHPGAVVTEYAWPLAGCDPCPPDVALTATELETLGAGLLPPPAAGPIRLSDTRTSGHLEREAVEAVVRPQAMAFRRCVEEEIRVEGGANMWLEWDVDPNGRVAAVRERGDPEPDDERLECIQEVSRRLRFPRKSNTSETIAQVLWFTPADWHWTNGPLVLTRLHYRYGEQALGEDLVFRAADPIGGGREGDGIEARPAPSNAFQGRYIIRHEWEGPIECENPQRGQWGGPPADRPTTQLSSATDVASGPRGDGTVLEELVETELPPELLGRADAASGPGPARTSSATGGCACRTGGSAPVVPGLVVLTLVALRFRARR